MQIAPDTPNINKTYRYPKDIGTNKSELPWILFQVVKSRHVGRNQIIGGKEPNTREDVIQSCVLYLPPEALKSSMDIGWDREEYGVTLGKALETGIETTDFSKQISSLTSAMVKGDLGAALGDLKELGGATATGYGAALVGVATIGASEILKQGIAAATPGMTADNVDSAFSGATGQRINTRVDLLYQSIDFREHEMSFKLIPRSKDEAEAIDQILNLFHYYSLPSFGNPASLTSMLIGYPYEFKITMFSQQALNGSGHHINTIERSVLTHIDVNHAAADRTSFINNGTPDYYPTATILNLTFKEVRLPGRDPRSIPYGGGNVVLRGPLKNGYPAYEGNSITEDPRDPSNITRGIANTIGSKPPVAPPPTVPPRTITPQELWWPGKNNGSMDPTLQPGYGRYLYVIENATSLDNNLVGVKARITDTQSFNAQMISNQQKYGTPQIYGNSNPLSVPEITAGGGVKYTRDQLKPGNYFWISTNRARGEDFGRFAPTRTFTVVVQ